MRNTETVIALQLATDHQSHIFNTMANSTLRDPVLDDLCIREKRVLACPVCDEAFVNPKKLPSGETLCLACIGAPVPGMKTDFRLQEYMDDVIKIKKALIAAGT